MSTDTLTGLIHDMDDATYHARPELSSTGVRRILDSPRRFQWEQANRVEKREYDVGHYVHAKVLGVGMGVAVLDFDSRRTNAYKEAEAEAREQGLIPMLAKDVEPLDTMAEAVLAHAGARALLETPGAREVSAFATCPDTAVACRARFDHLAADVAVDLKTTAGRASQVGFAREAAKHGYPIQEAHYADVHAWATGAADDERIPMAFVVVEKAPPHLVAVHYFDEITRMVARDLAAKARVTYAECVATDTWPAYGDEPLITQVPGWWLDQADDMEDMVI